MATAVWWLSNRLCYVCTYIAARTYQLSDPNVPYFGDPLGFEYEALAFRLFVAIIPPIHGRAVRPACCVCHAHSLSTALQQS